MRVGCVCWMVVIGEGSGFEEQRGGELSLWLGFYDCVAGGLAEVGECGNFWRWSVWIWDLLGPQLAVLRADLRFGVDWGR